MPALGWWVPWSNDGVLLPKDPCPDPPTIPVGYLKETGDSSRITVIGRVVCTRTANLCKLLWEGLFGESGFPCFHLFVWFSSIRCTLYISKCIMWWCKSWSLILFNYIYIFLPYVFALKKRNSHIWLSASVERVKVSQIKTRPKVNCCSSQVEIGAARKLASCCFRCQSRPRSHPPKILNDGFGILPNWS